VIAIENVRLFTALRERTDDLTQSLDYQTATSELLEVISRSTSDLTPVLDTMLAAAARLCGVRTGDISIRRDGAMRYAASIGTNPTEEAWLRARTIEPGRTTCAGRALLERRIVHVVDQSRDPDLQVPNAAMGRRTVLSVPLLREGEPIGVITLVRDKVEAFAERQIALIRTFADQAVIAIENARLLSELRERTDDLTESLEYQTATSELLEVISRSASDLRPCWTPCSRRPHACAASSRAMSAFTRATASAAPLDRRLLRRAGLARDTHAGARPHDHCGAARCWSARSCRCSTRARIASCAILVR
jgi:transcriptional regulator with GAF, ATPase, and Fis domain